MKGAFKANLFACSFAYAIYSTSKKRGYTQTKGEKKKVKTGTQKPPKRRALSHLL